MSLAKPVLTIALCAFAILAQGCASPEGQSSTQLNDQRFGTVHEGMSADQVREALGPPAKTMKFSMSGKEAWDYQGTDSWGYMVEYSVTFGPDQRVASKLARRINDGGEHGSH
ncbi:MAG TPA: hypothetical protein VMG61_13290 [Usitatibacter sp.]|nr:hypothetical protein [Usitatibacter sp.]